MRKDNSRYSEQTFALAAALALSGTEHMGPRRSERLTYIKGGARCGAPCASCCERVAVAEAQLSSLRILFRLTYPSFHDRLVPCTEFRAASN